MATRTVNVNAPATLPRVERFVRNIEEMSPVVPLVVCLMWGTALILLSFAFGVSRLPYGVKHVGWIYELNWSSTFAFFIPLSLYFSSSVLTSIPQIISALARGRMVRSEEGTLADSAALILNWRHRAGKTAMLAAVLGGIGFIVSWIMYFAYCIGPAFRGTVPLLHSWQNATSTAPGSTSPGELAIFGFLAYTSQGAAIACYVYYILMIFTFAAWVFDYTTFEPGSGIFPDLTDSDTRYGFEQFEPFIENVLFASIAFFFQFFMTRLYYIYMADTSSTSMFDLIARTMGPGFGKDVFALFVHADASLLNRLNKVHRRRIHAVPQPRRLRTVIEHVPQVRLALPAFHFGPHHPQRVVVILNHVLLGDRLPETRPPRPRLKLRLRTEQRIVAADTPVNPVLVVVPRPAAERSLCSRQARHFIRQRRKLLPPLSVGLRHARHSHLARRFAHRGKLDDGHRSAGPARLHSPQRTPPKSPQHRAPARPHRGKEESSPSESTR
jgi:hypothetical protein